MTRRRLPLAQRSLATASLLLLPFAFGCSSTPNAGAGPESFAGVPPNGTQTSPDRPAGANGTDVPSAAVATGAVATGGEENSGPVKLDGNGVPTGGAMAGGNDAPMAPAQPGTEGPASPAPFGTVEDSG